MRDRGIGRQPAFDQPGWGRRLNDTVFTGAASVFGPAHDQHPELRRHNVEPLAHVLANPVKHALAARAGLVADIHQRLEPRQMRWQ